MHRPNFKNTIRDPYVIGSVVTGVILLILTLHFRVNPVAGCAVDEAISGTFSFVAVILFVTTMPAYIPGLFISFATFNLLFYPLVFLFQIIIYTFLGLLLRLVHRVIKRCLHLYR